MDYIIYDVKNFYLKLKLRRILLFGKSWIFVFSLKLWYKIGLGECGFISLIYKILYMIVNFKFWNEINENWIKLLLFNIGMLLLKG